MNNDDTHMREKKYSKLFQLNHIYEIYVLIFLNEQVVQYHIKLLYLQTFCFSNIRIILQHTYVLRMNYKQKFTDIAGLPVLVIGDVMVDTYIWGSVERISPEAPVPVVSVTHTEHRLGGAANVVKNLAALGLKPLVCTVIGNDDAGATLVQLLHHSGIDHSHSIVHEQRKTTVKTRVLSGNHQILRIDNEQTNSVSPEITEKLCKKIQKMLVSKSVSAIVFQDYDKGVITKELIEFTAKFALKYSVPIFVDPKKRNFLCYDSATLFKPNFKEFVEGIGKQCKKQDIEHLFILAKEFMTKHSIEMVMITLSEHGIFIANQHEYTHIPSQVRHVADVSGAGDTVISTTVACHLAQLPMFDVARISNIAAGLACEQPGVVTITLEQLLTHV